MLRRAFEARVPLPVLLDTLDFGPGDGVVLGAANTHPKIEVAAAEAMVLGMILNDVE